MFVKSKEILETLETKNPTNPLRNYRLPYSKERIKKNRKEFQNLSSEIVTQTPGIIPPKHNHSIRALKTHRKTTTGNVKNLLTEMQSPRQADKLIKTITLFNYFHVNLHINNQEVQFKSYATCISTLMQEIKKTYIRKQNSQNFVLESLDNNLALNYYLSLPNSKTNPFYGKTMNLKPYFVTPQPTIDIKSFHIFKCIGQGGFSKVFIARFKGDGMFYAMKVISKAFIKKNKKQRLVQNQRNVMVEVSHPLHAHLHWCFQSKNYLVLVMDYYPGGELFGVLRTHRRVRQSVAKFYIIEILLGLEKLHDSGIVYRDIKPQNILLDREGHAHLADFGLAKPGLKSDGARAFSFCGSPQYMPPEIIKRKGHTLSADFYSLGALLYELVTGLPPFYCRDPEKIYDATLNKTVVHFTHFSTDLKNLLESLLCKESQKRIGSKYGVRQILNHPWFGKVDALEYISKKIQAPVTFKNLEDINFNHEESDANSQTLVKIMEKEQTNQLPFTPMFQNFNFNSQNMEETRNSFYKGKKLQTSLTKLMKRSDSSLKSLRRKPSKVNNFF